RSRYHRDRPTFPTRRSSDLDDLGLPHRQHGPHLRPAVSLVEIVPGGRAVEKGVVGATAEIGLDRRLELAVAEREGLAFGTGDDRSEEHTSELQSRENLVCRL